MNDIFVWVIGTICIAAIVACVLGIPRGIRLMEEQERRVLDSGLDRGVPSGPMTTITPFSKTETHRYHDGEAFSWTSSGVIPRDEVNPDTLASVTSMVISALESEVEESEASADWESILVSSRAVDSDDFIIQATVRRAS